MSGWKSNYAQLLRDPRWQRKRLEILNRSDFSCEECCAADKTLNVHHKRYRKGAKPWEYEEHELTSLCEDCHLRRHTVEDTIKTMMDQRSTEELFEVLGYLQARDALEGMGDFTLQNESHLLGAARGLTYAREAYLILMERDHTKPISGREAHEIVDQVQKGREK